MRQEQHEGKLIDFCVHALSTSLGWLTKFSDVIGASHMNGDTFWKYGDPSTLGLRDVAEHGATQRLEDELKQKV